MNESKPLLGGTTHSGGGGDEWGYYDEKGTRPSFNVLFSVSLHHRCSFGVPTPPSLPGLTRRPNRRLAHLSMKALDSVQSIRGLAHIAPVHTRRILLPASLPTRVGCALLLGLLTDVVRSPPLFDRRRPVDRVRRRSGPVLGGGQPGRRGEPGEMRAPSAGLLTAASRSTSVTVPRYFPPLQTLCVLVSSTFILPPLHLPLAVESGGRSVGSLARDVSVQ